MTELLVSVLIPCYNAERWIAETLESVYAQSWPNIEVIVVDDGSTDGSADVLKCYVSRGLKVVKQPNRGQTAALNRCLQDAQGEFIQYLDADDILAPDKIERQMRRLLQHSDCIGMAEWARFKDDPQTAVFQNYLCWQDLPPVDWLVANWQDGGGMMYPAMWLLPRSIVDSIGSWREDLTLINDTEYFTRAVLASRQVLFSEGARTYYRSGIAGSLSGLKSRNGWQSQFIVIDRCQSYLLGREDSDRTRRVCAMLWQRLAHASYPYDRPLANRALVRANQLHQVTLVPEGGPAFRIASRMLGWKAARTLQKWSGRP
jgi:glycosyltransferase involved in cell wall biosynthesis